MSNIILIQIGLFLNFVGTFSLIIETISGNSIRPRIYYSVLRGVYQFTGDYTPPIKLKLMPYEKRILLWMILICIGFFLQMIAFLF